MEIESETAIEPTALHGEIAKYLYSNSMGALVTASAVAGLLAYMLWPTSSHPLLIGWLVIIEIVYLVRIVLVRLNQLDLNLSGTRWLHRFRLGAIASGLAWGSGVLLLFPANDILAQSALSFTVIGLTAGGAMAYAIDFISLFGYVAPLLLALIARLFGAGTPQSMTMGIMLTMAIGFIGVTLRRSNKAMHDNIRLRIESAQREEMIRASNAFLNTILDNEPECVKVVGQDGRLLQMNPAGLAMLEAANLDEAQQTGLMNFIQPEHRKAFIELHKQIFKGNPGQLEFEVKGRQGTLRWLETHATPLRDVHGKVTALLGLTRDVTARKAAREALMTSEKEYRHLVETLPYGVAIHRDGKIVLANRMAAKLLAADNPQALIGLNILDRVHPDFRAIVIERARAAIEGIDSGMIEEKLLRLDGAIFDAEVTALAIKYDKQPASLVVFNDVSSRKLAEEDLRLAASVYQNSSEGMLITDVQNCIVAVNPAFTALTGYSAAEALGKTPSLLKSGRQSEQFYQSMWAQLNHAGQWSGEIWNRRKDGTLIVEYLSINTIYHDDHSVHRRVALFTDITNQKQKEEVIWHQANYDALTGLPNRRLLHDRLEHQIKMSQRNNSSLALLFIDLDRFKEINDALGHDKGDQLLKEAARRIQGCIRETDTVSRWGGDEFTVILPEFGERLHLERIATNIIQVLANPFEFDGGVTGYISASIGITLCPDDAGDLATMLKHADQAMYAAKAQGRNRLSYFTPSMQQEALEKLELTNELRKALTRGELKLFYQPILELGTGNITKAEALLRWEHPQRGMISPLVFIPLAEEAGLISEIGNWVLQESIASIEKWRHQFGRTIQISVNKSPSQFEKPEDHLLLKKLATLSLRGSITIEITEGMLLQNSEKVMQQLLDYRELGIEVSIDDFGTGFSALSYLKQFDVDYLKIDRSFISTLTENESDKALTEAIIVMAHKLKIKTIAEGVETAAQRDLLIQFGCDYVQGYLYSRPVPRDKFEKLLEKP